MAIGGQASEVPRPIPEMEEIAGHLLNARERHPVNQQSGGGRSNDLNHFSMNGGAVAPREESISIQEPGTCQLVSGQHQPRYLQSARANGLSYPTQEMGLDTCQRQDRREMPYPIQETGPFAERTSDESEDLPLCHQQCNGADVNEVSSTGEREQAVERTCSCQELQLWRQESDRQADVTSTTFVYEIKYTVLYVKSCMTGGNNHQRQLHHIE